MSKHSLKTTYRNKRKHRKAGNNTDTHGTRNHESSKLRHRNRTRRLAYDYYAVEMDPMMDRYYSQEEMNELAIREAEERTRLYAVPCDWTVVRRSGDTFTVRRRRTYHRKGVSNGH